MDSLREAVLLGSLRDGLRIGDVQTAGNLAGLTVAEGGRSRELQIFLHRR
jgi:hypothetical protein